MTERVDTSQDHYAVLQVAQGADAEMLKAAFRVLSKRYHPDLNGGSEEPMKRLTLAYDVLSSPERRRAYDAVRAAEQAVVEEPAYEPTSGNAGWGEPVVEPPPRPSPYAPPRSNPYASPRPSWPPPPPTWTARTAPPPYRPLPRHRAGKALAVAGWGLLLWFLGAYAVWLGVLHLRGEHRTRVGTAQAVTAIVLGVLEVLTLVGWLLDAG